MRLPRASRTISPPITVAAAVLLVPLLSATAQAAVSTPTPMPTASVTPHLPADAASACAQSVAVGHATCLAIHRTDLRGHIGLFASRKGLTAPDADSVTAPAGYGPADLQSAYALPSVTAGAGETVAIVDAFDDPNAEADLQVYRAQYGLPPCTTANGCFRKVTQDGSTNYPTPDSGWAEEESLDLDMASAICPGCNILLVEANDNTFQNLGAAVNEAVALGAKYVSNSYSGPEFSSETTFDPDYDHPGVVVTASTGDDGFAGGVGYPAASQYVTAVGGTTLTRDSALTRGWSETMWSGAGSGCSAFEPKPAWQMDTGCANRTVGDVSADADPGTGVAVYDSFDFSGWDVFGGTSVSSPVIASAYALAGTPVSGSYPSSYPYTNTSALNDVTSGRNGICSPSYLCTAAPGYDGPTGLGTPDGVAALTDGPEGDIVGTVADTGGPLADATVRFGAWSVTTNSAGAYDLTLPTGRYAVTASDFGHTSQTMVSVVTAGQVITKNFTLTAQPTAALTGTVTDGSGEGWPLYAKVSVPGTATSTYTNPKTGQYTLTVPAKTTFTVAADAVSAGYQEARQSVSTGGADGTTTANLAPAVDAQSCRAPGYVFSNQGSTQTFDPATAPDGWSVVNATDTTSGWVFNDPGALGNNTGGAGNFAVAYANGNAENTQLVSPVTDLSQDAAPIVQFNSDLGSVGGDIENVDVSIDGGQTWTTVWQILGAAGKRGPDLETVPLPMAADQPDVQVRFTYNTDGGFWWEVDNVFIGNQSCVPQQGGLIEGTVTDRSTGAAIDGATVTTAANPGQSATTATVPGGADGFYALFDPVGNLKVTAAKTGYVTADRTAGVAPDTAVTQNYNLTAGRLTITPGSVSATVAQGGTAAQELTFADIGNAPVTVQLAQDPGAGPSLAAQPAHAAGAPLQQVKSIFSLPLARFRARPVAGKAAALSRPAALQRPAAITPSGAAWVTLPSYPLVLSGNAAATDPATGLVYSVGGSDNNGNVTNQGYVYNPGTQQWTTLPGMQFARLDPVAAFINGKLYVAGGEDNSGAVVPETEIYDPASGTWSTGASMPHPFAGSAVAVVDGQMFDIGGCDANTCGFTDVQVYNPSSDTWSTAGNYPVPIAQLACGGIGGKIICAGGTTDFTPTATNAAFTYDPGSGTWSAIAPLPASLWGMEYAASNGQLLVSGGEDGSTTLTNQGWAYNPALNAWTSLPNSNLPEFGGGGACGFYIVTGWGPEFNTPGPGDTTFENQPFVEQLPGYNSCGQVSVPWLSESSSSFTLDPGQQVTITVTLNAGDPSVTGPGAYTAALQVNANTPYEPSPIDVTMNVS